MKMAEELDCGDILSQQSVAITDQETAQTLLERLAALGAQLLTKTLPQYASGAITPRPQGQTGVSYARKIRKEDGRLDWALPARPLWNRVRALLPWPGAFTLLPGPRGPRLLRIWCAAVRPEAGGKPGEILQAGREGILAACGQGALAIEELQLEGGRKMTAAQFLSGHPLLPGSRLG
jgi:methionyl-tRNA formyltransferase